MLTTATMDDAKQALKKFFGYDSFRPMQSEIIETVLGGKDALVLMPTGGGKSICFQVPAIISEGTCIVVSPLIALMKDQVEGLRANGVPAAFINSSLSFSEQQEIESQVLEGNIKLLYVSPEKLLSQGFFNFMQVMQLSLIAIDEAHCISAWGHDFRPEYTQLKHLKAQFPQVPIIALTATADKTTRKDIISQLQLPEPEQFVASFDRPNIKLTVAPGQQRFKQLLKFVQDHPKDSGIIYCLSRRETERVAEKLQEKGINAGYYHAGLTPKQRSKMQEDFIKDKIPIMSATVAFGMGIDKSNVRWVVHYNMPKNLEGYYQEIGRAGRDGLNSDALLMYSYGDYMTLQGFVEESGQAELQQAKLDRMKQFAESSICRRRMLLSYFGEQMNEDCGNCDVCLNPPKRFDGTVLAQKALSAIARLKERVGIGLLIDVLRGSSRKEIMENGYHQIKTYGAGRDLSYFDWQQLVWQLLNLGLLEVAYDEGHALKLTEGSKEVLFNGRKVELIRPADAQAHAHQKQVQSKPKSEKEELEETLFQELRELRKQVADDQGIPPYLVFNDATLKEMAKEMPVTLEAILKVSGVGQKKAEQFGLIFIEAIISFIVEQVKGGKKVKGSTYLLTYELYQNGYSLEDISRTREIGLTTVESHLSYLYEKGFNIDIYSFITEKELDEIGTALRKLGYPKSLKEVFEYLEERMSYGKIKLGTAYWNKKEGG